MFENYSKQTRIILFGLIGFSCFLIIPILVWAGFIVGYKYCEHKIKAELKPKGILDPINQENQEKQRYTLQV